MEVTIDRQKYQVETGEFPKHYIEEFCNLNMLHEVGDYERLLGLVRELIPILNENKKDLGVVKSTHGGFFPLKASDYFPNVFLFDQNEISHRNNILTNQKTLNKKNLFLVDEKINLGVHSSIGLLFFESEDDFNISHQVFVEEHRIPVLFMKGGDPDFFDSDFMRFSLTRSQSTLFLPEEKFKKFNKEFHTYLKNQEELDYDNLIHLCIMVKNGGDQFEQMLTDNLPIIDRWTIMDTGSTDNTKALVEKVLVGKKKGELIEMPFQNFRDNRNALLDAAGDWCKYTLMLDDTYVVEGNLREFLNIVRGDQFSDSFSIFIKSDDMEYGSNRLLKTYRKIRYLYKIHEVIDPKYNKNVIIPMKHAYLDDRRFDYMEKRTMDRKDLDLKLLYEELEEDPDNPRTHYYLGQTYNLLGDYENAFKWFKARVEHNNTGFIQEKVDAAFEMARIANFRLKRPWEECLEYYNRCFELDKTRPEAMYFIGMNHYLKDDFETAFSYLKKAFEIGYPMHCQYSLKPTLSFYFCPKFITTLSYQLKEYELGYKASQLFLAHNKEDAESYREIYSWNKIYQVLLKPIHVEKKPKIHEKKLLVFIADGNWKPWNGQTLVEEGLGGSETYIAEMARHIQKTGHFQVYVFCRCSKEGIYEGVIYQDIEKVNDFVYSNYIHSMIVSRFTEYMGLAYDGWVDNVYFVAHDLTPSLGVFPIDYAKFRKLFCLTDWHSNYVSEWLPLVKDFVQSHHYGIDQSLFQSKRRKTPFKFIYSSFPNRGLLPLLQMWTRIKQIQPLATLNIYCNLDHEWTNQTYPEMMKEIKQLLTELKNQGIFYHGWTDKKTLAESWQTADIWFYPCIFAETFCLTALEAALSKTFVVTNGLAALENTVGDRGLIIPGDPNTAEWQEKAIQQLKPFLTLDLKSIYQKKDCILRNYEWASELTWENQANRLLKNYLLKEKYEYKNMYNWTKDIVRGSYKSVMDVIKFINENVKSKPIRILEIGSWAGTSLIHFVENIPGSIGYGIDSWENYEENSGTLPITQNIEQFEVEKSFHKNVQIANLQDRIFAIKSRSTPAMMKLLKENQQFDFIFVDGDHSLLGSYIDTQLAWELLRPGGVLGLDDVGFHSEEIMDSPLQGVRRFAKEKEGQYEVLYNGYQVFLYKKP